MQFLKKSYKILLFLPAEFAHNLAILLLKTNLIKSKKHNSKILSQKLFQLNFPNPVGLAAGFDKNAEVIKYLNNFNFGFIECGTVTIKAQQGNKKPRIFRLSKSKAIINRCGFNNIGMEKISKNFSKRPKDLVSGINISKQRNSKDHINDYLTLMDKFYQLADYITINISSPNTPNLRKLQEPENLETLLKKIKQKQKDLTKQHQKETPIFLKISPDLTDKEISSIAKLSLKHKIDALIVSNSTITRPEHIKDLNKTENGGLTGAPLFEISNEILKKFYIATKGKIPLIGVGGINSAEDAYKKIQNGASLIQIYSGLIYQGFDLINQINQKLPILLKNDGFSNISEAIGSKVKL
jgi:dihydroorotate dehydrogenase